MGVAGEEVDIRATLAVLKRLDLNNQTIVTSDTNHYADWVNQVRRQTSRPPGPSPRVRRVLARHAKAFHSQAGTLTEAVAAAIEGISSGSDLFKISHQPNTFVTQNIATMSHVQTAIVSHHLQQTGVPPVVVFILIDYDVAGDARFRGGTLPTQDGGHARLRGAVHQRDHDRLAFAIPLPSRERLVEWSASLTNATIHMGRRLESAGVAPTSLAESRDKMSVLLEMFRETWENASSLVKWNSFALSHIVNLTWRHNTVFIPASFMIAELASEIEESATVLAADSSPASLVWRTCPVCFTRCRCTSVPRRPRLASSACPGCGFSATEEIDFSMTCRGPYVGALPVFVPRVYLCDAMDLEVYRFAAGVTYAGGIAHTVAARTVHATRGGVLPPELIWEPTQLLWNRSDTVASIFSSGVASHFQRGKYPALLYMALANNLGRNLEPPTFSVIR